MRDRPVVIGTAGHVDHGKTRLVYALTGRDTDRLEEEKRRGITIDLGFTWMELENGEKAGIIDVPGHERLIRNMAAGVAGMDAVLLVIAADEGVMPQTIEHVSILELLGVEHYIIVLNKCDLADEEWLDLAQEEIRSDLAGTKAGSAPIVRVSALTGEGIEALKEVIRTVTEEAGAARRKDRVRFPVDRVFVMQGFGTVVTGTMLEGEIRKGDLLAGYPSGISCRVRGIQIYGEEADCACAGQRAALNLSGTGREELGRGDVLSREGMVRPVRFLNVRLRVLEQSERIITNQMRLHLIGGTSELLCRVVLLDREELGPGESGYAQLRLESDGVFCPGDRFVVRFYSPLETIGGGVVLETTDFREKRGRADVLRRLELSERKKYPALTEEVLLGKGVLFSDLSEMSERFGLSEEEAKAAAERLAEDGRIYVIQDQDTWSVIHREKERLLWEKAEQVLRAYEKSRPFRRGIPELLFIRQLFEGKEPPVCVSAWLDFCVREGRLERKAGADGKVCCRPGYDPCGTEEYRRLKEAFARAAEEAGGKWVSPGEMEAILGQHTEETEDARKLMEQERDAVHLAEGYYTGFSVLEPLLRKVEALPAEGDVITVSQVRDLCQGGRKHAKLLLEYTDRTGLTRKNGTESERLRQR